MPLDTNEGGDNTGGAISLRLPLPPSVNALYLNVPGVGRVKTKRYKAWIVEAGWQVNIQLPARKTIFGDVRVNIRVPRKGDADGRVKALFDLMSSMGVWGDDKQVSAFSVQTGEIDGCVIEIEPAGAKVAA